MSGWQDTLDAQMELFKFWRSPLGQRYGEMYLYDKTVASPLRHGAEADPSLRQMIVGEHSLSEAEASKMFYADPVYVTDEMFEIAEVASQSFAPEPLQETDLLTERGFVLLPRPFKTRDINDKLATWRAFAWSPMQSQDGTKRGIHLSTYTSKQDYHLDEYDLSEADLAWQPLHVQPWWFESEAPQDMRNVESSWWIKAQSLMRLMMQHISVREERQAPRASRRRWQRDMPDKTEPYVVVVRLRRPKSAPSGEHREVEWKQRWIVSGHWRNQFYPSLGVHRQIWISPFVKGPDEKPLVVRKARAFELVR